MGKELKYFTPVLEDLRAGYECEEPVLDFSSSGPPKKWRKIVIGEGESYRCNVRDRQTVYLPFPEFIRTPYLTSTAILDEGWERINGSGLQLYTKTVGDKKYIVWYSEYSHLLSVEEGVKPLGGRKLYSGDCPSINEFRYIMKLLKIV